MNRYLAQYDPENPCRTCGDAGFIIVDRRIAWPNTRKGFKCVRVRTTCPECEGEGSAQDTSAHELAVRVLH